MFRTRRRGIAAALTLAGMTLGVVSIPFLSAPGQPAAAGQAAKPVALFGAAPATTAREAPDTALSTPKRSRFVSFRSAALPTQADEQKVSLPFFDDADFTGTVEHVDKQPLLTSWSGTLDSAYGTFVVTESAGRYQVTASTERGSYTMNMSPTGAYQVNEVAQPHPSLDDEVRTAPKPVNRHARQAALPRVSASDAGVVLAPQTAAERHRAHKRVKGGDDGSVEDILVAYSADAAAAYGGVAGIQAEAAKNIAYTNGAYANSGIKTTVRLVGVVPTVTPAATGTGIFGDLKHLTRRGDGDFDDVLSWVKKTHADDTILLVAPPPADSPVCGVANLIRNQPAKDAFAVVSTGACTDGFYTFPHELGHNQGAAHDLWTLQNSPVGQGPLDAQYKYGYGYVAPNFAFYTTMAYYEQCFYVGGVYCPQLLAFSNPDVAYGGQPTGTTDRNDVAKLISKTRKRVAAHQQSTLYIRGGKVAIKPKPVLGTRVSVQFKGWINGGVHTKYQWYRDGQAIKHAKHSYYRPTRKDVGKQLAVVVKGKKRHYAPVLVGSGSRKVHGPGKHKGHGHAHHRTTGAEVTSTAAMLDTLRGDLGAHWI